MKFHFKKIKNFRERERKELKRVKGQTLFSFVWFCVVVFCFALVSFVVLFCLVLLCYLLFSFVSEWEEKKGHKGFFVFKVDFLQFV
jgi:hypothetical protein